MCKIPGSLYAHIFKTKRKQHFSSLPCTQHSRFKRGRNHEAEHLFLSSRHNHTQVSLATAKQGMLLAECRDTLKDTLLTPWLLSALFTRKTHEID